MSRHTPLYSWTGQVASAFPSLSRPQATVLALYSFGAILAHRCGLNSVAVTLAALMGLGYSTIRSRLQEFYQPASAKSGTRRCELDVTTCFAPLLAWTLKGWASNRLALALDATSLGDRFTVLSISVVYRGSASPVAWRIVRQCPARLETRMDRPFALVSDSGSRRMDRDRYERPRVVCPLAVSGDRCSGLASLDANHSHGQVPQERIAVEPSGHGIRSEGRAAMARTWCGLPQDGSATARLHALGLLGIRSRRTMVRSDRLGAGPERQLVVRDAGLDRTGVQAAQTRRLAVADDSDDRPRPRKPVVAGAGCRHPLHTGRRWRSRRGRNAGRDGPRAGPHFANRAPAGESLANQLDRDDLLRARYLRRACPRSELREQNNAW